MGPGRVDSQGWAQHRCPSGLLDEMHSLPFLGHARVKVSCEMSLSHLARLDALKEQWGVKSRAEALHRLLDVCFSGDACLD